MRGKGSDQGGRWSVGIWFALVGVSAGTVASFSLIGWTFTRGLYDEEGGAEPFEFQSETVVLEAEETPEGEGVAGGEGELEGLVEPGTEPDASASPAEPQAGLVSDGSRDAPETPDETPPEEEQEVAETEPPQLVPVGEDDGDCGDDEAAEGLNGAHAEDHVGHEDLQLRLLDEIESELNLSLNLDLDLLD